MTLRRSAMGRRTWLGAAISIALGACSSAPPKSKSVGRVQPNADASVRSLRLPPRGSGALAGSAFVAECERLSAGEREIAIGREILSGNVPSFLRDFVRVPLAHAGDGTSAAIWATRDYLAIGSDVDFVRMPMAKRMAHKIARSLECFLPTAHLVDAIYQASTCKLSSPLHGASAEMASTELFAIHNAEIEGRRKAAGCPTSAIVAGPKKDLIISPREAEKPGHLAIYGWFHDDGTVIQPASLLHSERYVDFSHGVRLVSEQMEVDGQARALADVLRDPELSNIVSNEGAFTPLEP